VLEQDLDAAPTRRAAISSERIMPLPEERVFCTAGSAGRPVAGIGQ
jgi:hypothetical protein